MGVVLHHVGELSEEIVGIMRARGGFRVVLNAEEREFFVAHAFVGMVVEIDVGDLHVARGERFGIDAEAVILGGDFDLLVKQVLYGMVRTVMAKF